MTKYFVIMCIALINVSCRMHNDTEHLKLINAYEVLTDNALDPSGLTFWDGHFYSVSDKHEFIYRLDFEDKKVIMNPIITIKNDTGKKLDLEGITHDDAYFYLASELHFNVLKISKDGQQQSWLSQGSTIKNIGTQAGLFATNNANIEGICLLNDDAKNILLAIERQPRGFIVYDVDDPLQSKAYKVAGSKNTYRKNRPPDFSGLSCDNQKVFVINRNAYKISQLVLSNGQYKELKSWSYESFIMDKDSLYQDMQFGHAEGLVVEGDKMYLILDNNRVYHQKDTNNNNSIFLELQRSSYLH